MVNVKVEEHQGLVRMADSMTHIVIFLVVLSISSHVAAMECRKYRYCEGGLFKPSIKLNGKQVKCDTSVDPKDRCCLPQAAHLACYNITVNGEFLNFESNSQSRSTDFAALCALMLKAQNKTTKAPYTVVALAAGGGKLAYRYGVWVKVETGGSHIKDLACQYGAEPTTTPEPTTTVATTTEEVTTRATTMPITGTSTEAEATSEATTVNAENTEKTGGEVEVIPPPN